MIERTLTAVTAPSLVPRHVAVIMDGNRRWARERGLPAIEGHRVGADTLTAITRASGELGLEVLTVFAFSEENWQRESAEVDMLMELVGHFADARREALVRENVRVRIIGRRERMPAFTRAALARLENATDDNTGLTLNVALNYGARTELCDAVRAMAIDVARGAIAAADVDEDSLGRYLYTAGLPDPDLVIRTGGELRVSNFLLYQIAYAELWSTATYWPEFDATALSSALADFATRQRRFGK
jgi:undecaprenyl diphosphate synthase